MQHSSKSWPSWEAAMLKEIEGLHFCNTWYKGHESQVPAGVLGIIMDPKLATVFTNKPTDFKDHLAYVDTNSGLALSHHRLMLLCLLPPRSACSLPLLLPITLVFILLQGLSIW